MLYQSGITTDNLIVIAGVGTLCFTRGVPLEIVLGYFKERDLVVDWLNYITIALRDGHNPRTIRTRIETAVSDVYGVIHAKSVNDRVFGLLHG